jgi:hypothetical protein
MSPEQLAARHTDAIKRHWRTLTDSGGKASAELLGELAGIAQEHAEEFALDVDRLERVIDRHEAAKDAGPSHVTENPPVPRRRASARGRVK